MKEYSIYWNKGDGDQRCCEMFTRPTGQKGYSVSIRNRKEYEFIKVQYRTADFNLISMPLLIGLKYQNDRFHWFDNSTFNYTGFFEPNYKSRFYLLKKGQCRRFFMYSPPTYTKRKYYIFDIDCKVRFYEYRLLCRYKVPRSNVPIDHIKPDYSMENHTTQDLDYHDYWDNGKVFFYQN
ncbi:unnamed protein product [Cercopithifilaria johnstoni]|uniref:Uncharacterized protein n=1 Tax=Cercopithifilaria johnstoni TaxID=2874296 RepID=A0A8J2Q8J4_9BILA|nr:unnamed protein product [Cercopithifilaria johnstoni]